MNDLIKGQWYIIKPDVPMNVAPNLPIKYCGTEEYQDTIYHNFWEPTWKLWHWVNPDTVQPYQGEVPHP